MYKAEFNKIFTLTNHKGTSIIYTYIGFHQFQIINYAKHSTQYFLAH